MDPWYLENLTCPVDGARLEFDGTHLVSGAGHRYPVVDGVPVMLRADREQTMDIIRIGLERANGNVSVIDQRAPDYYLETLGVGEPQRVRLIELVRDGTGGIDPAVSLLVAATSGVAYLHLVGSTTLTEYPIPRIDLPAPRGGYFLDVGCNWGRWCVAATRAGHKAVGIDPSLGAVMAARRVSRQLGLDIKYVVGDARWLPFAGKSFDVVHSYSVVQHLSKVDARHALREVGRVLTPGGTAKIQMAHRIGIRSFQTRWRRGFTPPEKFDVRYWPLSSMKRSFEQSIGPTRVVTDCYFGLGWQWADFGVMMNRHKPILVLSELLKRLSQVIPPLTQVADSVYCVATKPKASCAGKQGTIMSADDPASPACLAHEADDAYMGFATRAEIARFLTELDAAPAAQQADMLRRMLPKIRNDLLHAELSARLAAIMPADSKA